MRQPRSCGRRRVWFGPTCSAILLRVALDHAQVIENTLVPDGSQGRLGDVDAVVEHPPADPNTDQPPEDALEWRAVENVEEVDRMQLPNALDPPETGVVDGADGRRRRADRFEVALHQRVIRSEERRVGKECRSRWSPEQ